MTSPWLWFASRACGIVSLMLLTAVVVLGAATAVGLRPESSLTAVAVSLHRTLALGTTVFVAIHISTAVLDAYVDLGWIAVVVPFTSDYHRMWVGVGAIAVDIFILVLVTSILRLRLSHRVWRAVHWLSYLLAASAVLHGLTMSADDQQALRIVTVACGLVMAAATAWRLLSRTADRRRRAEIAIGGWT
ncbi:ferric reductase-like transmembrane domain-containing protein [Gordonia sp. NPDC003950]